MKSLSSYGMFLFKSIIALILLILSITLLEYNNLLSDISTSFFLFLSFVVIILIGSLSFFKRGYLFGLVFIIMFGIISIFTKNFQYKLFLYYLIIEITSYIGYYIKKKMKK